MDFLLIPTYFVTVPACVPHLESIKKPDDVIISVRPGVTLYHQLLSIPDKDVNVLASPSSTWPKEEQALFAIRVSECYVGICVSRGTLKGFNPLWEQNSFENHMSFVADSLPVEAIKHDGPALICGNGPSLDISWFDGVIYACWHCVPRIDRADYVGHIDGLERHYQCNFKPSKGIVATPTVTPAFLKAFPESQLYAWYAESNNIHSRYALNAGIEGHPTINATVTDMLCQLAVMAGHEEIFFTGIDLSFPDKSEAERYYPGQPVVAHINGEGHTVYGHPSNDLQKVGFEMIAARNPNIKFYQTSTKGLQFEGFELYKP